MNFDIIYQRHCCRLEIAWQLSIKVRNHWWYAHTLMVVVTTMLHDRGRKPVVLTT